MKLSRIDLPDYVTSIGENIVSNKTNIFVNRGTYTLLSLWNKGYTPLQTGTQKHLAAPTLTLKKTTQTTVTVDIDNKYDEFAYVCNGEIIKDDEIKKTGLNPGDTGSIFVYVQKSEGDAVASYCIKKDYSTYDIELYFNSSTKTATTITVSAKCYSGDAIVAKKEFECGGTSYINNSKGNPVVQTLTGLSPNTQYTVTFIITLDNGKQYKKTHGNIKTDYLSFKTQQPKVIKAGNVIVQATSNLDDAETNVGFEWRRTDWTDDFASNTGTAYLYDGVMEGYIRNLNTEKLWKYRPYYESNSGTRYYGEWVGLDPTNTSYFEPTVHTYAKVSVNGNTASVAGYAQRGTDDTKEQGFYFWKTGDTAVRGIGTRATSIPTGAQKVVVTTSGSNPVMEATLTGLEYDADYTYVAYMTTDEGTYYGEAQTFATGADPTGIEDIKADTPARSYPAGIYDLQGRKHTGLQRGVNIVRYEDGTVKKVYVK